MTESVIVEFVGLPGVGKSTLSRTVATELKDRGTEVHEPIYKRDTYSTPRRIASKAWFAICNLLANPETALRTTQHVHKTDQQSPSDLIRVLFNIHYVTGVPTIFQSQPGITLLDQGLYQARWSVGLQSTQPITEAIETVDIPANLTPDLVVFVEATEATIANRLTNRTDGDTRFTPNSDAFERARDGYETIKSQIEAASDGPNSITIENETQESLKPNAAHIADFIQSIDK